MEKVYNLSVIIPIYIHSKHSYIYHRVQDMISFFNRFNNIELIFVDGSPLSLIKHYDNNKTKVYIHNELAKENLFSLAQLRNYGASKAKAPNLLFLDVDLICSQNVIERLLQIVQNSSSDNIYMFPYLFLTKKATLLKKSFSNEDCLELKKSFLLGENHLVSQIGLCSSIILISKKKFYSIQGFSEEYIGHGGEEFDFLHKTDIVSNYDKKFIEYTENHTAYLAAEQKGFRQFYAYHSVYLFFEDLFFLHRWHPKEVNNKYYSTKVKNMTYFENKIFEDYQTLSNYPFHGCRLPNFTFFLKSLQSQYGYQYPDFPGLFRLKRGVERFSKKNKLKKLIKNPYLFFKDMVLKRLK